MPQPDFYPEGTVPANKDTEYRLMVKILGHFQNQGGALAANNPQLGDTKRRVVRKAGLETTEYGAS